MELLTLDQVSIVYDNERQFAVENVSFTVSEGEYICLIGSNGSGKSTLLKGITGLAPLARGRVVRHLDPDQYGYLSQYHMIDRNFPATVYEVILSGTQSREKHLPFYTKEDKKMAARAMEMFGVMPFKTKRIGHLSGGQQQRVLLARAFCKSPKLLLLDEPCAGLDPVMTREFYEILDRLNKEEHIAILMASHDMEQVENYAKRVIVMNQTVEFDGSVNAWKAAASGAKNAAMEAKAASGEQLAAAAKGAEDLKEDTAAKEGGTCHG